jgi:hypothetical protein
MIMDEFECIPDTEINKYRITGFSTALFDIWQIIITFCDSRDWLALHLSGNRPLQEILRRTPGLQMVCLSCHPFLHTFEGLKILTLTGAPVLVVPLLPPRLETLSIGLSNGLAANQTLWALPKSVTVLSLTFSAKSSTTPIINLAELPSHIIKLSVKCASWQSNYALIYFPSSPTTHCPLSLEYLAIYLPFIADGLNYFLHSCTTLRTLKFTKHVEHTVNKTVNLSDIYNLTHLRKLTLGLRSEHFSNHDLGTILSSIPQCQLSLKLAFQSLDGKFPILLKELRTSWTVQNLVKLHVDLNYRGTDADELITLLPCSLQYLEFSRVNIECFHAPQLSKLKELYLPQIKSITVPSSVRTLCVSQNSITQSNRVITIGSDSDLRKIAGFTYQELERFPIHVLQQLTDLSIRVTSRHFDSLSHDQIALDGSIDIVIDHLQDLVNKCHSLQILWLTYRRDANQTTVSSPIIEKPLILARSLTELNLDLGCTFRNIILPSHLQSLTLRDTILPALEMAKLSVLPLSDFSWAGRGTVEEVCAMVSTLTPTISWINVNNRTDDPGLTQKLVEIATVPARRSWLRRMALCDQILHSS